MAMIAAERPVDRRVAALDLAVGMLMIVRTDDAAPALGVDVGQHQPGVGEPAQHAVAAGVADLDGQQPSAFRLARRDAQRLADGGQRELTLRVKFHQPRLEPVRTRLLVDRTWQAAVAHGVGGTGVRVACGRNGRDGRDVLALGRLLAERIAPLVVAGRCLDDPRRLQRRLLGLRADVIQHHEQDVLAVGVGCRHPAVLETVEDE